jgi:hypothetical protein
MVFNIEPSMTIGGRSYRWESMMQTLQVRAEEGIGEVRANEFLLTRHVCMLCMMVEQMQLRCEVKQRKIM